MTKKEKVLNRAKFIPTSLDIKSPVPADYEIAQNAAKTHSTGRA